jgi:hypothetical protein
MPYIWIIEEVESMLQRFEGMMVSVLEFERWNMWEEKSQDEKSEEKKRTEYEKSHFQREENMRHESEQPL